MPSDVVGTSVFNTKDGDFRFKPGPVFSNIILIDEINRAPAKTQAALFEVMEERQVTVDGVTHEMRFPFLILATQNPVEQEGTYRLPEAQLDRFIFKIDVQYPRMKEEISILLSQQGRSQSQLLGQVNKVLSPNDLHEFRQLVQSVIIEPKLVEFIAGIVNETRNNPAATRGYPPSVFARLPQLGERAGYGPEGGGSITAFYTVLGEGDDQQDPIADSARAILDGHIVLPRPLADAGHYPANDIEQSISRAMVNLIDTALDQIRKFKVLFARYQRSRDLISVGAYAPGSDPVLDQAIALYPRMESFLQQQLIEQATFPDSLEALKALI